MIRNRRVTEIIKVLSTSSFKSISMTTENLPLLAVSFTQSQKGKPMLVLENYVFKLNKVGPNTKYWICTFNGCSAKAHTTVENTMVK